MVKPNHKRYVVDRTGVIEGFDYNSTRGQCNMWYFYGYYPSQGNNRIVKNTTYQKLHGYIIPYECSYETMSRIMNNL